jgi:ATP-dependent RNA helicase SUPV3L1/SUV3
MVVANPYATLPADRVLAVLGPTNTGKTHLAVERMLGHAGGIIGLPLRLLAREIYDRVARIKGAREVALITGEEKLLPKHARWFICTVEAMPLDRPVPFLAIDEIQLCADPERGHVFTDRLLRARGLRETMFLGAETMRPIIRRLVPEAEHVARPRFSTLSYAGHKKLSRLPRRSAVVAFSASEVYAIAEQVRRQRGGAAVVLGALSPRTRNAQVALYQSGEVDYMVATDAVGMGLNMDVDHVAFAGLRKFDGYAPRDLTAAELGQIAGRAGRHMRQGTFGVTGEVEPLAADLVERIENHRFDTVKALQWRNSDLEFRSLDGLIRDLERPSPNRLLIRARDADDYLALKALAREPEIAARAVSPAALRLLWECCQIPDFAKTMHEAHVRLVRRVYGHLMAPAGVLPEEWVARHLQHLDRTDGDIDTLSGRIAHVRTWTFITHRETWLADAKHWQERARAIEDRLSDALHERLTQRFVDRRNAVLLRRLSDNDELLPSIAEGGAVLVEGQYVGRIEGLAFIADAAAAGEDGRALRTAANRVLAAEIAGRAMRLANAPDDAFGLAPDGRIHWFADRERSDSGAVARLLPGATALAPRVEVLPAAFLDGGPREAIRRRLVDWLGGYIARGLAPLMRLRGAALDGAARGLAFRLAEALGILPRAEVAEAVARLTPQERGQLKRLGVRFGPQHVYLPAMLKPAAVALRLQLWAVQAGIAPPAPPPAGAVSLGCGDPPAVSGCWTIAGYQAIGERAVRIDMLDRLAVTASRLAAAGPFVPDANFASAAGWPRKELPELMRALGFRSAPVGEAIGYRFDTDAARRAARSRRRAAERPANPDSPFAGLAQMRAGNA